MVSIADHMIWLITFQYYLSVFAGFVIAANVIQDKGNNVLTYELDTKE